MKPLQGIRVAEFVGLGPGPFAAMLLADGGADVLRIDRPRSPVDGGALTRGRPVLNLDLKKDAGRGLEIVRAADVLIEGFRPGVMERLGLGPDDCRAANPGLIYGRMTGWGQEGPRAQQAGHDINYLGLTGALRSFARAGQAPVPPLNVVADYGGGGLLLAFGILAALQARTTTGRGQVVDAAMVDGVSLLMTGIWSRRAQGRWPGKPGHNELDTGAPFYDVYATSDGCYMPVGSIEPQFWARLQQGLGIDLPDQWDRARWPEMKQIVAEAFATRTRAEWTTVFDPLDACVTPVLDLAEAPQDAHLAARGTLVSAPDGPQPAAAPRLSETPFAPGSPDDVEETLARWGVPA
ncbi:MAG: CoA transferase [Pseudonocardia sp.]|uniref:CaiB/BaiF CoA transferase family protein n=1 Tax=unclassified Pseudonocardia TaxID=2619320 RepID=UPI0008693C59|nr:MULTISPECIES: CaiB/BaiF CoA-transferase family protein [unclassified Pseudonocardia]MBN9113552.1 CoA transferase [Pseudonocardia sp.]ODU28948.1 MAG: carnitine dehydratase [Pseudonocardia sp. SCN 72-51]ODU99530.1 MAG: carnitine dehydratase [Pseudonocardia sp. SCN 73-27]